MNEEYHFNVNIKDITREREHKEKTGNSMYIGPGYQNGSGTGKELKSLWEKKKGEFIDVLTEKINKLDDERIYAIGWDI